MSQGLHQVQKQTQSLVLAPQLRQSLKILQAPAMELRNAILEELESNPLLEELALDSSVSLDREEEKFREEKSDDDGERDKEEMDFEEDYAILHELNEDWKEYFAQESRNNVYSSEDAERRQHFFDSLVAETSLQEHLMRQAEMTDLDEEERQAIQYLIGSLDDRGFLTTTPSEVALMAQLPLKKVQIALESLKNFDPAGIGAEDLADSLLLQLRQKGRSQSLAAKIIREQYKFLLRRRIPEIARKCGVSMDEVHDALEEISELDPSPGRRFSEDQNRIVNPDVRVEKDDSGEWIIHLNNDYIPRLRLNNTYKELLAKGKLSKKEKDYVQEKMRSGKFLINSIEQRQQTIERITREILKFQADFFEKGVSGLKPLTMNRVAQAVDVHETTVSRAIANKYIDTPHGVFEFKYFFTPGYQSSDGKSVSNTSIKDTIAHLIESENPEKPLSDQEIVKILAEKDFKIARRTVAKYREEMGILPTNLRRRYR